MEVAVAENAAAVDVDHWVVVDRGELNVDLRLELTCDFSKCTVNLWSDPERKRVLDGQRGTFAAPLAAFQHGAQQGRRFLLAGDRLRPSHDRIDDRQVPAYRLER